MRPSPRSAVIVGAGAFGLAGALELRRRGFDVDLIDPGPLPHPDASSTDISKAVRMDYGADELYAAMAERAIEGWRRWNTFAPRFAWRDAGTTRKEQARSDD